MDEELKQHLTAMESRLVELVTGVKESLEREAQAELCARVEKLESGSHD